MAQHTKWAVVTGASSGIGLTYARALAASGHSVVAVARRLDRLEALRQELEPQGAVVVPLAADLQTAEGVEKVLQHARGLPSVDVLVNSAGFAEYGAFSEMPPARSTAQIDLNVRALVELTGGLLPRMIAAGRGEIVNVASGMAFQAVPYFAVYAATKAFVLSFTEAIAQEAAGTGVTVQALCPGVTRTEFGSVAAVEEVLARLPSSSAGEVVEASRRGLAKRRVVITVGFFTWLTGLLARVTPRAMNRWVSAKLMGPRAEARRADPRLG